MKRRELIKTITRAAKANGLKFTVARQGGKHEVYELDGLMVPIPRHNDIDHQLSQLIFKNLEPKLGKRWWK